MKKAFTLIELLVVIAVIAILASITVPSITGIIAATFESKCAYNQRKIVEACIHYANDATLHRGVAGYTLPSNGPEENDDNGRAWWRMDTGNPGSLWLLVEADMVDRAAFLCPAAETMRGFRKPGNADTSFTYAGGVSTLSYSYISMVAYADVTGIANPDLAKLVILADQNPNCTLGLPAFDSTNIATKNSANHNGEGQNVARMDTSVVWVTSPVVDDDNVFQAGNVGGANDGKRVDAADSFLVP